MREIERGSTRSHSMENSLSKRLWTCYKRDYVMMMMIIAVGYYYNSVSWYYLVAVHGGRNDIPL
jgi:hypothetical protein